MENFTPFEQFDLFFYVVFALAIIFHIVIIIGVIALIRYLWRKGSND